MSNLSSKFFSKVSTAYINTHYYFGSLFFAAYWNAEGNEALKVKKQEPALGLCL